MIVLGIFEFLEKDDNPCEVVVLNCGGCFRQGIGSREEMNEKGWTCQSFAQVIDWGPGRGVEYITTFAAVECCPECDKAGKHAELESPENGGTVWVDRIVDWRTRRRGH